MSGKKKILFVIMDGLGDRGCKDLDWKTPLQYTDTPNLDWFTANGTAGIVDIIAPGVRPGSDTAHLSILGYDPFEVYKGRGPFEAAGIGLISEPGDVTFRCNFSTINEKFEVTDRRAGRITDPDTTELAKALDGIVIDGIRCLVKEGTEHRAALILRGKGLSADVSDVDPHHLGKILTSEGKGKEAQFTASVVNKFIKESYKILKDHPVNVKRRKEGSAEGNVLLTRGAGSYPDIVPFQKKNDIKAACVAGVGMIKGICKICGLDVLELPSTCTGGLNTDMLCKANEALKALERYDFVLMNVKAPDVSGHDSAAKGKCDVVKRLDEMAGFFRKNIRDDVVILFTADHCTPVDIGDHTGDPVAVTIYTKGIVIDDAVKYSETGCAKGRLGRLRGKDLLPICMDLADRTEKFGA